MCGVWESERWADPCQRASDALATALSTSGILAPLAVALAQCASRAEQGSAYGACDYPCSG